MQPSEINCMPFYLYEVILNEIKQIREEEQKHQEEQEKEYSGLMQSPKSMMNDMTRSIKQPGGSNFNMPNLNSSSFNMPKVNIPKL